MRWFISKTLSQREPWVQVIQSPYGKWAKKTKNKRTTKHWSLNRSIRLFHTLQGQSQGAKSFRQVDPPPTPHLNPQSYFFFFFFLLFYYGHQTGVERSWDVNLSGRDWSWQSGSRTSYSSLHRVAPLSHWMNTNQNRNTVKRVVLPAPLSFIFSGFLPLVLPTLIFSQSSWSLPPSPSVFLLYPHLSLLLCLFSNIRSKDLEQRDGRQ